MALRVQPFSRSSPRKQTGGDAGDRWFDTIKDRATIFAAGRGTILSVVPDTDIHPELRSAARFVPPSSSTRGRCRCCAGSRLAASVRRRCRAADTVLRCRDPAAPPAQWHGPGSGPAVDTRWRLCAAVLPGRHLVPTIPPTPWASRSPRCATGWRPSIPTRAVGGLLQRAAVAGRAARRRPRPDRHRRQQRRWRPGGGTGPADPRPRRDQPGAAAAGVSDARRPQCGQTPRRHRPPAVERHQQPVRVAVVPIWVPPTPRSRCQRAAPISRVCHRPGSESAPSTCSTTRTSSTPDACSPPGCRVRCIWFPAPSTVSTG